MLERRRAVPADQLRRDADPGAAHRDAQATSAEADGGVDRALHGLRVGDVRRLGDAADLAGNELGALRVQIRDRDLGALGGEAPGGGLAET